MVISILAVGTRMQSWVYEGFDVYQSRLPRHIDLQLIEVPAGTRTARGNVAGAIEKEGEQLLRRLKPGAVTIALDEAGRQWRSRELAVQLQSWLDDSSHVALMIGGPDGLSEGCRRLASQSWSLSRLTLPHGLVRVVLAEQIYRAWTILQGHPYHRS